MSLGNPAGTCICKAEGELRPGATFDKAGSAKGAVNPVASHSNVNETICVSKSSGGTKSPLKAMVNSMTKLPTMYFPQFLSGFSKQQVSSLCLL